MEPLHVKSLSIRDVLGIKEFAIKPGEVTLIRGKNASGKTGILEGLAAGISGGNLANLARIPEPGEDPESIKPEVVWVFGGDDSREYRAERRPGKLRLRRRVGDTQAFEDVPSPQAFLSALFDQKACNPLTLLRAKGKDLALLLLEALPLEFDHEDFRKATGLDDEYGRNTFKDFPDSLHALQRMDLYRDAIFRERTGVNRDAKAKRSAAEQAKLNTPAVIDEIDDSEIATLERDIEAEVAEANRRRTEAEAQAKSDSSYEDHNCEKDCLARQREVNSFAANLRAEIEGRISAAREAAITKDAERQRQANEAKAAIAEGLQVELAKIEADRQETTKKREHLATLRAKRDASIRDKRSLEMAAEYERDAEEIEELAGRLTSSLTALDAYRLSKLSDLPISGLEIVGDAVKVDGVPWDQVNKARRYEIAVKIASLRTKDFPLKVVFVDDAESLDSENFGLLVEELKRQQVTAFIGRVTDDDLTATVL